MARINLYHIRRCHVCGTVNEVKNAAIYQCLGCRKHLAPFYYFEECENPNLGDDLLVMSRWAETAGYHPLLGLSTYWEDLGWEDTG